MRQLISTKSMSEALWLEHRKTGIGGSDAAAVAGLNPWKSPLAVWVEKTSEEPPVSIESERMRIGKDLEDYVARRFVDTTGMPVRRCNAIMQHDTHDWMLANVDRLLVGVTEGLECKVTNSYAKQDWEGDKIPIHYEIQCHHYMAVTGYTAWWIAALVGNEAVVIKKIERDEDTINRLIEIEKHFWENYVLAKQMPAPDGSEDAKEIILQLYPDSEPGSVIDLSEPRFISALERRTEVEALIKKLEAEKAAIDQTIQVEMGETETAHIGDRKVTWKVSESGRIDADRIKKELPDVYANYTKKSKSKRFLIK